MINSVFENDNIFIDLAEVAYIEKHWYPQDDKSKQMYRGLVIVTKFTTWNQEIDTYNNSAYITLSNGAEQFIDAWLKYREQLNEYSTSCINCERESNA